VSQGIETTIEFLEEVGWVLTIPENEHERALEVIRLYRTENLHWPWRKSISKHDFVFDWGALAWVFLICGFFWLDETVVNLRDIGLMNAEAVSHGEWWRLVTAIFLHANLAHLAANATIGLVFVGLSMGAYGTGIGLLASLLAGVGGNAVHQLFDDGHSSLGASGMVMGALGLLAASPISAITGRRHKANVSKQNFTTGDISNSQTQRGPSVNKYIFSGLAAGMMLLVLLGTSPDSDVIAHVGGFLSGVFIGIVFMLKPQLARSLAINIAAGIIFCFIVTVAWWAGWHGVN